MQVSFLLLLLLASYKVILCNSLCKNTFELIVELMHLFSWVPAWSLHYPPHTRLKEKRQIFSNILTNSSLLTMQNDILKWQKLGHVCLLHCSNDCIATMVLQFSEMHVQKANCIFPWLQEPSEAVVIHNLSLMQPVWSTLQWLPELNLVCQETFFVANSIKERYQKIIKTKWQEEEH